MIKIDNVTQSFGSRITLNSIQLELEKNQTHVIIGESGSGKTTLLRSILGLNPVDNGEIFIENIKVSPQYQQDVAAISGYVIQKGGLFPHMTAWENVTLMPRIKNWTKKSIDSRVQELLELTNLEQELLDRYPAELSGGQCQRLGLIRALMMKPDYLFLDEPLGALDPVVRSELQEELKDIFQRLGKTVVIVTHDISEAAFFGDSITLLHQGKIEQHGKMEEFVREPNSHYVSKFIQSQRPRITIGGTA